MLKFDDCLPDEIVNLCGKGPMTLVEAVHYVMSQRQQTAPSSDAQKATIYRKSRKNPWALDLADIERLAKRPEFSLSILKAA